MPVGLSKSLSCAGVLALSLAAVAAARLPASAAPAPRPDPAAHAAPPEAIVDYNRDVRPILAENCFACHGLDRNKRQADLRLDKAESALAVLASGKAAIVPGRPDASELIRRITAHDEGMMPPAATGKKLTRAQLSILTSWVAQGGKYAPHWAYVPLSRPAVPPAPRGPLSGWPLNPIDRFVLARLQEEGWKPSPGADRPTLLRRLSFDLTGLPPTAEEVAAFVADKSPDAYEKVVDRLLASPHYGERMAVYWLDLVRYADTDGYHGDRHRSVYPYRDWVIHAFNSNMPFNQFTVEQLAGDLLPNPTIGQQIASGYNRLNMVTREGGAQPREYLAKYAAERVRTTSVVWMGATLGCAECHDHKYDPFTTRDFYRFAAFFADVQQVGLYPNDREDLEPILRLPNAAQDQALTELDHKLAEMRPKAAAAPMDAALKAELAALETRRANLDRTIPRTLITASTTPMMTRVLARGNWMDETGEVVQPGVPGFLPQPASAANQRATRLDLARWLVSRENPLTARVLANRLWMLMFGAGLVRSPGDFGLQGSAPTHPELLDWLTNRLVDDGWNVKSLLRLIVTSRAYRQSSRTSKDLLEHDPYNLLLARQGRYRVDAEFVRDNALAVSGLLSDWMMGRSVRPYQPDGYWDHCNTFAGKLIYEQDHGQDLYRRGVYTYWKRSFLHPSLLAFDAPGREECVVERPRSNTPLQALVLLNDPTYVEAARVLATRALGETGISGDKARLEWLFRRVLSRVPTAKEADVLTGLLQKHRTEYTSDPAAAQALLAVGERKAPANLPAPELAAWTSVARTLLNLHETITRE